MQSARFGTGQKSIIEDGVEPMQATSRRLFDKFWMVVRRGQPPYRPMRRKTEEPKELAVSSRQAAGYHAFFGGRAVATDFEAIQR